ncbi:PREDICTED: uncharacterized protein LOC105362713 [Ceratosolen solmsi marchali]|uniref:Uncharacterized protein LOC105362713 n=1 Tax=Ceratosolen solmsi marchali TaxID=326594 RepID=A0AAJ6YI67_9HYME|nr:PREDICTED: uncharacterized protein LOC105362713 [Ceratosolen solmsi marchali]
MPQGSLQWQGTQRRTYAPGAHWNIQVVRGKVTTRCLWHACKALGIGLLLMLLGACMATIGYYADQLSVAQEIRGNLTIRVKNESRGFHLNNLSYAGPIVMGVGGFIVVAACVMTFEARDSAAKVVPARFRFSQASSLKTTKSQRNRKSTSSQTSKWDHQLGLFRVNRSPSPSLRDASRRQLTAEFVQFSKTLQDKGLASPMKKSPSAPSLVEKKSPKRRVIRQGHGAGGCALLNPELLKRHAVSVDNPSYNPQLLSRENLELQRLNGSQTSMAMDLHIPNKGPITLKVKDRSDTARRHQLARQTKIEDAEDMEETHKITGQDRSFSPKLPGTYSIRYPDDFVARKRNSVDMKILEDLMSRELISKTSPHDFRKLSSPNFRKMSLDRIGGERRLEKSLGNRKASFEFKRSPDFRKSDYRKYSIERFTADCNKYLVDDLEGKIRANSGENLQRKPRHPKLYHSRSDDNKRRSFDKHRGDSLSSRYSLNTQVVIEDKGIISDYELKYFTTTAVTSLDTEESRCDNSDCDSRLHDYDDAITNPVILSDGVVEVNTLLEEPELENLPEIDVESSTADFNKNYGDLEHYAKQETLSLEEIVYETVIDAKRLDTNDDTEDNKEAINEDTNENLMSTTNVDITEE